MSDKSEKPQLISILKKRKPLEDIEFSAEISSSNPALAQFPYFSCRELFCLDPLIKHLRTLKKPIGLFSSFFSPPQIDIISTCFCKYCFIFGLSDGSIMLVEPREGDLLGHSMVFL